MRLLPWLTLGAVVTGSGAIFQTYNGVIDGNICTDIMPNATASLTVLAPTSGGLGNIGIHQLAFQAVGNGYLYSGAPITINGFTGIYTNTCCSCDAIGQSVNGGFSECGLTWCGGEENQWQYLDFSGLTVQQNETLNIIFPTAVPIAPNANGDPIFSISYAQIPLSSTSTGSGSPSTSVSASISPTGSHSVTASFSSTNSVSSSGSLTHPHSASVSASLSLSSSSSVTTSITPSDSLTASPTGSVIRSSSETASVTASPTISLSSSESKSPDPVSSVTRSLTPSPAGICYSVSRLYGQLTVLGSYYYILPGFNVTQPYGSGFISMGNFVSCSVIGATCKCSYTQGSTVAGCGGRRNSYITYSYGAADGYSFVNESPTCSYNFVGTIGIPSSSTRSPSISMTISPSPTIPLTICPAALGRQGALEKVIGDVPYYIKHFVNIYHFRGIGIPDMFIGNYTGCNETATTCSCNYGPGEPTHSCPSGRFATIDYQFGMSTYTTFFRQYPACNYYFLGSIGIMSPSPPISSTPSPSISVTVTVSSISSISRTQTYSPSPSKSVSPSMTRSNSISGSQAATLSVTRTRRATNSVSSSITLSPTISESISRSQTATLSLTPSLTYSTSVSKSVTPSGSLTPSITLSSTISESISRSRTATPSRTHSTSSSESITSSESLTSSISLSISPSSTTSSSITGSGTTSESLTLSSSLTPSITISVSATVTPSATLSESSSKSLSMTLSKSPSKSPSKSLSKSQSKSKSITLSVSQTITLSATQSPSVTVTGSVSSSVAMSPSSTGTPLVYCIPYPSSTPTAFETPTSTPLVLITPWPTNGSATASTSPFFMMIPYPSLSPLPILINGTATTDSFDLTAMIVTGVAVGTMGIGSVALLFQYLKPPPKAKIDDNANQDANQDEIQKEIQITEVQMPDPLTYLCINTADLEDITFLLTTFRKRFQLLSPNLTMVKRSE